MLNRHRTIRVLLYHSIDKAIDTDTMGLRISPDDFRRQMRSLRHWGYDVVSIYNIFDKLPSRNSSKKKIILTFDDGYKDFMNNALPILEEFNYPATVFVSIEYLQQAKKETIPDYWNAWDKMSWDELKTIATNPKITFGSHGYHHSKMTEITKQDMTKEIKKSKLILEKELKRSIDFFCYIQ